jgi:hypothetical protein
MLLVMRETAVNDSVWASLSNGLSGALPAGQYINA